MFKLKLSLLLFIAFSICTTTLHSADTIYKSDVNLFQPKLKTKGSRVNKTSEEDVDDKSKDNIRTPIRSIGHIRRQNTYEVFKLIQIYLDAKKKNIFVDKNQVLENIKKYLKDVDGEIYFKMKLQRKNKNLEEYAIENNLHEIADFLKKHPKNKTKTINKDEKREDNLEVKETKDELGTAEKKDTIEISTLANELIELIKKKEEEKIDQFLEKNKEKINDIKNYKHENGLTPLMYAKAFDLKIFEVPKKNTVPTISKEDLSKEKYSTLCGKKISETCIHKYNVLSQISNVVDQLVIGNTCSAHSLKNAIFFYLQLIAAKEDNKEAYDNLEKDLTTKTKEIVLKKKDDLTTESRNVFENIDELRKKYDYDINRNVIIIDPTMNQEMMEFLVKNVSQIMKDSKAAAEFSSNNLSVIGNIDELKTPLKFQTTIDFAMQKELAKKDPRYKHSFVLAVKTRKNLQLPNHWISLTVFKDAAGNIIYTQLDSLNKTSIYPEVFEFKKEFENTNNFFDTILGQFNKYIAEQINIIMTFFKAGKINAQQSLSHALPSTKIKVFNNFLNAMIQIITDAKKIETFIKIANIKDEFNLINVCKDLNEKLYAIFNGLSYDSSPLSKIIEKFNENKNVDELIKDFASLKKLDPLAIILKKELEKTENEKIKAEITKNNLKIENLLLNIDRPINILNYETLLMMAVIAKNPSLIRLILQFDANPFAGTLEEWTAFDLATDMDENSIAKLILQYSIARVEGLLHHMRDNGISHIEEILNKKTMDNKDLKTIFILSAENGLYKLIKMLIKFEPKLTSHCDEALKKIPLHIVEGTPGVTQDDYYKTRKLLNDCLNPSIISLLGSKNLSYIVLDNIFGSSSISISSILSSSSSSDGKVENKIQKDQKAQNISVKHRQELTRLVNKILRTLYEKNVPRESETYRNAVKIIKELLIAGASVATCDLSKWKCSANQYAQKAGYTEIIELFKLRQMGNTIALTEEQKDEKEKRTTKILDIMHDLYLKKIRGHDVINSVEYKLKLKEVESILKEGASTVRKGNRLVVNQKLNARNYATLAEFFEFLELFNKFSNRKQTEKKIDNPQKIKELLPKNKLKQLDYKLRQNHGQKIITIVKRIINNKIDTKNPEYKNYCKQIERLLEQGAYVARDKKNQTALHYAKKQHLKKIIKLLINPKYKKKRGANPKSKPKGDDSIDEALSLESPFYLTLYKFFNSEIINLLGIMEITKDYTLKQLKKKIQKRFAWTPFGFITNGNLLIDENKSLSEYGITATTQFFCTYNPEINSIVKGDKEATERYVFTKDGSSDLQKAMENDIDVNVSNHLFLKLAISENNVELAKNLLKNGANIKCKNADGINMIRLAQSKNFVDLYKQLKEFKKLNIPKPERGTKKDLESIVKFMNDQTDNEVDISGTFNINGALHLAAKTNNIKALKALLFHGAKQEYDATGKMPIHYACIRGKLEIAKLLIERRADVNAKENNTYGQTPLHRAAIYGKNLDLVKYLVKVANADISTKNNLGQDVIENIISIKTRYPNISHEKLNIIELYLQQEVKEGQKKSR